MRQFEKVRSCSDSPPTFPNRKVAVHLRFECDCAWRLFVLPNEQEVSPHTSSHNGIFAASRRPPAVNEMSSDILGQPFNIKEMVGESCYKKDEDGVAHACSLSDLGLEGKYVGERRPKCR